MIYINADYHFSHTNMTKDGNSLVKTRAHLSVDEMDRLLIANHNRVVNPSDTTYVLGDLSMHTKPHVIKDYLDRMNGAFIIVKGNHDNTSLINYLTRNNYELPNGKMKFEVHEVGVRIKAHKKVFYLTHYPMQIGSSRNIYSLHGHIHEFVVGRGYALNVGVDSPEIPRERFGEPISLDLAMRLVMEKEERLPRVGLHD